MHFSIIQNETARALMVCLHFAQLTTILQPFRDNAKMHDYYVNGKK